MHFRVISSPGAPAGKPRALQRLARAATDVGEQELVQRDTVDCHRDSGQALATPGSGPGGRLRSAPIRPSGPISPGDSATGMKRAGEITCRPPGRTSASGPQPDNLPGGDVDLRLVEHVQVPLATKALRKPRFQRNPLARSLGHVFIEEAPRFAAALAFLGAIHRGVRTLHQQGGFCACSG